MIKFFRKHQKQAMAIFSVGLMIAFALPSAYKGMNDRNRVVGTINGVKLYQTEASEAREQWELLKRLNFTLNVPGMPPDRQPKLPLVYKLASPQESVMALMMRREPMSLYQIEANPDMFVLLIKEAQQMGVSVSDKQVDDVLMDVQLPDDRPDTEARARTAVTNLLMVRAAEARASDVVKISQPLLDRHLATQQQDISVNIVEFPAAEFAAKVAAPTTQQVADQFTRYGDASADDSDAQLNPYGFGYRYPNRVKLQYIAVPHEQLKLAVENSKSRYDWEKDAWKEYHRNPSAWVNPEPTTNAVGPQLPSTKPTSRPTKDVLNKIVDSVMRPQIDRLAEAVQTRITSILAADWRTYQEATKGTTQPAIGPTSSLGVPFGRFEYFKAMQAKLQQEFKVTATIDNRAEQGPWLTAKDLADMKGIGESRLGSISFASYASTCAKEFNPNVEKPSRDAPILEKMQPSAALQDAEGGFYFFRLTAAEAAHKPMDMADVKDRLEKDVRTTAAIDQARLAARDLLDAAKGSDLATAAAAAKRKMINSGLFRNDGRATEIPNYSLSESAKGPFMKEAFDLLTSSIRNKSNRAMGMIELPREQKMLVVELADVKPGWTPDTYFTVASQSRENLTNKLERIFRDDWYSYESLVMRMRYQMDESRRRASSESGT